MLVRKLRKSRRVHGNQWRREVEQVGERNASVERRPSPSRSSFVSARTSRDHAGAKILSEDPRGDCVEQGSRVYSLSSGALEGG